jgi:hypothetical protein
VIFVGIDWAEAPHGACVLDQEGRVLAKGRGARGGCHLWRGSLVELAPSVRSPSVCHAPCRFVTESLLRAAWDSSSPSLRVPPSRAGSLGQAHPTLRDV